MGPNPSLADANNIEQLVICTRWEDKEMTVCEEYIGLMPVAQTNADTIVVCIKDVQILMNLRLHDAYGQCYDGCLTMTGTKSRLLHKSRNLMKMSADALLSATHLILLSGYIKNIPLLKDNCDMA